MFLIGEFSCSLYLTILISNEEICKFCETKQFLENSSRASSKSVEKTFTLNEKKMPMMKFVEKTGGKKLEILMNIEGAKLKP